MTPAQIKATLQIVGIVLILALVGALAWVWKDYQALKTYREATETRQETTSQIDDGLAEVKDSVSTVRIQVEQSRSQSDQRYQEVIRNDQSARAWADEPIPDSLRNIDTDPINRPDDN